MSFRNFILCGLPCCGKTSVGKRLAEQLNFEFIDIDQMIEMRFHEKTHRKITCRQIFLELGCDSFRNFEKYEVSYLKEKKNCVIATGGGVVLDAENRVLLSSLGTIIYLKASREILVERMLCNGVPAYLKGDHLEMEISKMMDIRNPLYEAIADISIEIHRSSVDDIVKQIVEACHGK